MIRSPSSTRGSISQWVRLTQGFWDWNSDFKAGWFAVLKWTADKNDEMNKQWAEDWETQKQAAAAAWEWLKGAWASVTGGARRRLGGVHRRPRRGLG